MKSLLLALQFLTIIPVKIKDIDDNKMATALIYFPVIGLLLGLILVGADNFLIFLGIKQFSVNIILIILLIILTGGLHLDGLADTCDAFLSRKDKEEMLRIMRDSHIGVMGVLSLISVILLKIAFLSSIIVSLKMISLLLICTLSRWSLVFAIFLFPYARKEGKAKAFIQGVNLKKLSAATIIALLLAFIIWKFNGLAVFIIIAATTYLIGKFISRRLGGITGDALGAINELTELIILFSIYVLERSSLWMI
jgi:adenosylcobinamide-GDP ribazoletransferase